MVRETLAKRNAAGDVRRQLGLPGSFLGTWVELLPQRNCTPLRDMKIQWAYLEMLLLSTHR